MKKNNFSIKHPMLYENMETALGILGGSFLLVGTVIVFISEKIKSNRNERRGLK